MRSSTPTPQLWEGQQEQVAQGCVHLDFEYLQRQRIDNVSKQPVPIFGQAYGNNSFPFFFFFKLSFVYCAHCILSFADNHLSQGLSSLQLHQIFIHIGKILLSLLFYRLNCPSSLSLFLYPITESSLWPFAGLFPTYAYLLYWEFQSWTQYSVCSSQCWVEGICSLHLLVLVYFILKFNHMMLLGHNAVLCSTWCSPGTPDPFLLSCFLACHLPACIDSGGCSSPAGDLSFAFVGLNEIPIGQFLQTVETFVQASVLFPVTLFMLHSP